MKITWILAPLLLLSGCIDSVSSADAPPPRLRKSNGGNERALGAWTTLTSDDFQNGWGNFKDNDTGKAKRVQSNGFDNTSGANYAIRLRDDNDDKSQLLLKKTDVSNCSQLRIKYQYKTTNYGNNDSTEVQYSKNNGNSWKTVKTITRFGSSRENGVVYGNSVIVYDKDAFPNKNANEKVQMTKRARIRFKSNANNGQFIFIDNVEFDCYT